MDINTGILIANVLILLVYGAILGVMMKQLKVAKEASNAQNMLSVLSFLQDYEVRKARTHVLETLKRKDFSSWSEKDKESASLVASSYDTTAILLKENVMPESSIIENWGPSIINCHRVLEPYINELRKNQPEGLEEYYWDDFDCLYDKAVKLQRE